MVLVRSVKQTPKEPLGTSTRSSEDKDPEIAIIDKKPGASDSARKKSRKRKQECLVKLWEMYVSSMNQMSFKQVNLIEMNGFLMS